MKIRTAGALLAFAVAFPLSFTETHPGAALVALCVCIGLGFWVIGVDISVNYFDEQCDHCYRPIDSTT